MHISCRQVSVLSPRSWKVVVSGDGSDRTIDLQDPFKLEAEEKLVQWYIEDYANKPFAKHRARAAAAELRRYGTSLWQQLGIGLGSSSKDLDCYNTIVLSIVLSQGQTDIDRLHWEVLETFEQLPCRVIIHRTLYDGTLNKKASIPQPVQANSGILRILVVSARSNKKADVPPRLTSLPLVETLRGNPQVELSFVHMGTFEEFEKALDERPTSERVHLVHFDLHGRVDKKDGPILEFTDSELKHRKGRTASSVAAVLRRNGVEWAVLCACRTAQTTSTFNHLALNFLMNGITGIFAMRYELKASAATILTSYFYSALCKEGMTFIEAGHAARRAMQKDPSRPARFGELVKIQDSLVPAMYSIAGADFRLGDPQVTDGKSNGLLSRPQPSPPMIGREDDIRKLSMLMREKSSFCVISGDSGTGKSLLMEHLAWWWKESKLFRRVIYVNVSLARTDRGKDSSVGLLALARGLWRSVLGKNAAFQAHCDPMRYLRQAMESAEGQDCVILLDGVDLLYHASSRSDDTAEGWIAFFQAAEALSATTSKLVVATCEPLLCAGSETSKRIFQIGQSMTTADAWRLVRLVQLRIKPGDTLQESPDTHLLRVFDVLQYNPMVVKSLASELREKFHGLETILSWEIPFDEDLTERSFFSSGIEEKLAAIQKLDLGDSKGLGRVHHLVMKILSHLVQAGQYRHMWALLSIGLWIDVLPHPDAVTEVFTNENLMMRAAIPILHMIVSRIPKASLRASFVPFELWAIMNEKTPQEPEQTSFTFANMIQSLKHVVRLLTAAKLLTGRTDTLIDGKRGYRIHPAFTLCVRRILQTQLCTGICLGYSSCMEDRAIKMADLNTLTQAAIKDRAFPFIEKERWNLVAAIVAVPQYRGHVRELASVLPNFPMLPGPLFAWCCFELLVPICFVTEDFCTWLIMHAVLKYVEATAPLVSSSLTDPLPVHAGRLLLALNCAIVMTQRYRLEDKETTLLRHRRVLMARVKAMRDAGTSDDELNDKAFVRQEMLAWVNEVLVARKSPEIDKAEISQGLERIKALAERLGTKWELRVKFLDHMVSVFMLGRDHQLTERLRGLREEYARCPGLHADEFATQTVVLDSLDDIFSSLYGTTGTPVSFVWVFDILRFMKDLDFFKNMPPWYIDLVGPIFTHLRRDNIRMAMDVALRGLDTAERDGHVLLASNFRQVCHRLGEMDVAQDYDAQQALLARVIETSHPFLRKLLTHLANHSTLLAYWHASVALSERKTAVSMIRLIEVFQEGPVAEVLREGLSPADLSLFRSFSQLQDPLEGMDRIVALLEPYKDEWFLEDRKEWVQLVQRVWDLLPDLASARRPEDLAVLLKVRERFLEVSSEIAEEDQRDDLGELAP